jgi:hypothetical protein
MVSIKRSDGLWFGILSIISRKSIKTNGIRGSDITQLSLTQEIIVFHLIFNHFI